MNLGLNNIPSPSNTGNDNSNSGMFWSPAHLRITPRLALDGAMEDSPRFFVSSQQYGQLQEHSSMPWSTTPQSGGRLSMESVKDSHNMPIPVPLASPANADLSMKGFDPDMFFNSPRHGNSPMMKHFNAPAVVSRTPQNMQQSQAEAQAQNQVQARSRAQNQRQSNSTPTQVNNSSTLAALYAHMQQQQQQQQQRQNASAFSFNQASLATVSSGVHPIAARAMPVAVSPGMFSVPSAHALPVGSGFFDDAEVAVIAEKRGSSCHQCKRKQPHSKLVFCTNMFDKKHSPDKRLCRKKYCYNCLAKFYGMDDEQDLASSSWQCPSCKLLCTCAACVRKRSLSGSVISTVSSPEVEHEQKASEAQRNPQPHGDPDPAADSHSHQQFLQQQQAMFRQKQQQLAASSASSHGSFSHIHHSSEDMDMMDIGH